MQNEMANIKVWWYYLKVRGTTKVKVVLNDKRIIMIRGENKQLKQASKKEVQKKERRKDGRNSTK